MFVVVRFFARSRELVGEREIELELDSNQPSLQEFETKLLGQYPVLKEIWESVLLSRNLEYVSKSDELELKEGDEMAIIPPISGG